MALRVLYVENTDRDWKGLKDAVDAANQQANRPFLILERSVDPSELKGALERGQPDVVIADVLFDDPARNATDSVNKLEAIIKIVRDWEETRLAKWRVPIIAYTGRSKGSLDACLLHEADLVDILDKNSASFDYLAWRLRKLEMDYSSRRPDRALLSLIVRMESPIKWHGLVREMAAEYGAGWNERDQIGRVGSQIRAVADKLGTKAACGGMWKAMTDWEFVERAVATGSRGHARHVLNVFWLGYYLLGHKQLAPAFHSSWQRLIANRQGMATVAGLDPSEALAGVWFYAGLFHDIGNCIEKSGRVADRMTELFELFEDSWKGLSTWPRKPVPPLSPGWLGPLEGTFWDGVRDKVQANVSDNKIDSGIVGATLLLTKIKGDVPSVLVREAIRGVAVHDMFLDLAKKGKGFPVSWEDEPIVALLVLCDQLQTWDREGDDRELPDQDRPENAELLFLEVGDGPHAMVRIGINYFTPPVAKLAALNRRRVHDWLVAKISDFPIGAAAQLSDWPFGFRAEFYLDGKLLEDSVFEPKG